MERAPPARDRDVYAEILRDIERELARRLAEKIVLDVLESPEGRALIEKHTERLRPNSHARP